MNSSAPLAIILGIVGAGSVLGFIAGRRRAPSLEEWVVGGRSFGVALVWLLMAGEVFTTYSLLGLSGWVYSRGGPVLYALVFINLCQVLWFYLGPPVWEMGRQHGLQTLPDYFARVYGGGVLPALVALSGVLFLIVYLQLQLTGLGIIVGVASFDRIGRTPAIVTGAVLVAGFVFTSGIRGVAWVSVLKDGLLLAAAVVVGIGLPWIHFGGIGPMFAALAKAKPGHLVMPGATTNLGHGWFISSVLLSTVGAPCWPHYFGSSFTAKSADVVRRNAVLMPLYSIALFLIVFAGCAAILVVPNLKNGDLALLMAVRSTFPPWFLGVIGGAGALTAMVPAANLVLTASTLFAKNLWRPSEATGGSDLRTARLARFSVLAFTALASILAIHSSVTLVALLLMAYAGVGQFFPGILFGICCPWATRTGILAGLVVGLAIASFLIATGRDPFLGLNAGFTALLVNFAVAIAVSVAAPASRPR